MGAATRTDAYGNELTFALLDELARAVERRRVDPIAFLSSRNVVSIGPLVEYFLLHRQGALPFTALPANSAVAALQQALSPAEVNLGIFLTTESRSIGFIATGRDIEQPNSAMSLYWTGFCQRAQKAAERSLPKLVAQGLIGAMIEIEDNVHLHSERANDGVVGFRGTNEEFEFVIGDSGIGMLGSLRRSPDYSHLTDTGNALRLALQDGQSRLSHLEPNHGYGFSNLFRNLATLNGSLRFRSDDQAITLDGVGPELVRSVLSQKPLLQGFAASIICRPTARAR